MIFKNIFHKKTYTLIIQNGVISLIKRTHFLGCSKHLRE